MKNNNHLSIINPAYNVDFSNGLIQGESVINSVKYLKDLTNIFEDEQAFLSSDKDKIIYQVQAILPAKEGHEGGLFYGKTLIESGTIGNEYFMTKGHFHQKADRAEFYWGIQGEGILLLMDKNRQTWAEKMYRGSLHYINAYIAHRTINTGNVALSFGACWHSDAGHNYREIMENGFSARVKRINGTPKLVES